MEAVEVPQGITGEVTKGPHGPVDILENPVGVGIAFHVQVQTTVFPPAAGEFFRRKFPGDKLFFQLETENDVKGVADLIGVDPDKGGPALVNRPVEGVGVKGPQLPGK
jgi:hypothetical protein